jgi:hypothetical protein
MEYIYSDAPPFEEVSQQTTTPQGVLFYKVCIQNGTNQVFLSISEQKTLLKFVKAQLFLNSFFLSFLIKVLFW